MYYSLVLILFLKLLLQHLVCAVRRLNLFILYSRWLPSTLLFVFLIFPNFITDTSLFGCRIFRDTTTNVNEVANRFFLLQPWVFKVPKFGVLFLCACCRLFNTFVCPKIFCQFGCSMRNRPIVTTSDLKDQWDFC